MIATFALILSIFGFFLDFRDWKESDTLGHNIKEILIFAFLLMGIISVFYFPFKYRNSKKSSDPEA